ncbi:MAG: SDR family NAD(P)-dependent oxidoreductase [Nitrospiria bacterium]
MRDEIREKVVFVSGGGRGIGRAAVSLFARAGAKVAFCARTEGECLGVANEVAAVGGMVRAFPVDITSRRDVRRMISEVASEWGRIDFLINNAGVLGVKTTLATYPPETWDEVIRINVNGTFYLTQAVVREMIPKRSGTVLSISSSVGRKGRAAWGAYAVSKFALEGMMQTLAEEVAPFGIRVITLNPEATRTQMRAKAYPKEDPAVLKEPSAVSEALLKLAASADPSLHGQSLNWSDLRL